MGRRLDKFWKYAERLDGCFKCKFCHETFPGGISRLKSHLSGIRGRDIDICDQVSKDVQAEAFLAIEGSNKKAKNAVDLIAQDNGSNGSTKDLQRSAVSDLFKKKNKGEVDRLLVKHFISNDIAFDVIETSTFKEFVRSVAAYGPGYEVPSQSVLETQVIPDCMRDVDNYIERVEKEWEKTGCTLMYDVKYDIHQRPVLNIVAYSSGGAVFKSSVIIRHDDCVLIKDNVSSVIEDIGPDHVVQIITKHGFVPTAADMLIAEHPHIYKTKCATHGIEQLLKDIYEEEQWVREVIDNAKLIVRCMYEHNTVLSLMKQYTDNRELKHPCKTRYASNFKMLQSLLDVKEKLRLLIASSEWGEQDYSKGEMAKKVAGIIQNSNFWSRGRDVLKVLEPLVQVLRLVEGEGSTSGYLYEAMERAEEKIRRLHHKCGAKYRRIWDLCVKRRQEDIIHPVHAAAAFLNPSYMCSEDFKEKSTIKDGVCFMLKHLVSPDESYQFMAQIQSYRAKVSTLFTDAAKIMLKTSHPRVWWDYCGDSLPILKKYAIRILSQPCSSSSFEQNWNTFEAGEKKKRNRFTPHVLNNFVQGRMNMLMMENFKTMEERLLRPIDLEKLSDLPEYIDPPEEDWEDEVRNSTQENLNHATGMHIVTAYTGDQPAIGNVAHQHGGDGGGGFGGNQGKTAFCQTPIEEEDLESLLDFSLSSLTSVSHSDPRLKTFDTRFLDPF